jgi:hypothetical protein
MCRKTPELHQAVAWDMEKLAARIEKNIKGKVPDGEENLEFLKTDFDTSKRKVTINRIQKILTYYEIPVEDSKYWNKVNWVEKFKEAIVTLRPSILDELGELADDASVDRPITSRGEERSGIVRRFGVNVLLIEV